MPMSLDTHEPLLVNTLGHLSGLLVFAILLVLFLRDRRGASLGTGRLPAAAASLALLWNLGSLCVLAASALGWPGASVAVTFSFSVLSVLPAVLLRISIGDRLRSIARIGYGLSAVAVYLHITELAIPDERLHRMALLMISVGFGVLTAFVVVALSRGPSAVRPTSRIGAAMSLFLLAISFVHFGEHPSAHAWSEELALHHAGIPLAVLVLLQDYRFLLLDVFIRFLANTLLAGAITFSAIALNQRFDLIRRAEGDPFLQALAIAGVCLGLTGFAVLRSFVQRWLTHFVFRRSANDEALKRVIADIGSAATEDELLQQAAAAIAATVAAERYELRPGSGSPADQGWLSPELAAEGTRWNLRDYDDWVEAVVPIRLSRGDTFLLLLGRRSGGRRYLSEDFDSLAGLARAASEQVERFRAAEMQRLTSRAEFRALQSQINPHFLFNALNALFGVIPRQNEAARRMVQNLSSLFRYFLQSDKLFVTVAEELRIVTAYLEIEKMRVGDRMTVHIDVDDVLANEQIPALSIQPLVENAVKHGIAAKPGPGRVSLRVRPEGNGLRVEIEDTGDGFGRSGELAGAGVGLDNVRQRLRLCYGDRSRLDISSSSGGTLVVLTFPAGEMAAVR